MTSRRTEDDFRRDLEVKRSAAKSWRDHIKVHPAADLFPPMSPDELKALGEDIKKNGLKNRVPLYQGRRRRATVDGRNRLDAMEQGGLELPLDGEGGDPGHAARTARPTSTPTNTSSSANLHRRHLTAEDKRDLIAQADQGEAGEVRQSSIAEHGESEPQPRSARSGPEMEPNCPIWTC